MISQTAEYALRAIVHLAQTHPVPQTAANIAERTHVPVPYLSKVMQSLTRVGLVSSQRGLHGGFALVQNASSFSVLDVITAVEPLHHIRSCPLKIEEHKTLCMLHGTLEDALVRMEEVYAATPIDRLLDERDGIRSLCGCLREEMVSQD
ncbi:MAG TPA: Rrf2 family transcriptional regulator [Fibrobacteria bacterium]|nr:Rrf2 family transcriptional regulator [Fibrobacteria bacterium]